MEDLLPETKRALKESQEFRKKVEAILSKWREQDYKGISELKREVGYYNEQDI